jgi:hypothetical protein
MAGMKRRSVPDETFRAIGLANAALCDQRHGPAFTTEAEISDHKQHGGEFEGQTLRKVFQPGPLPHMAMILMCDTPRVVVLKRGASELI